ncbi:hypothetical protein KM043_001537 [Ampulex compressa]|nr:hypothetical protein KM043_001537 [Ampulex compressa]
MPLARIWTRTEISTKLCDAAFKPISRLLHDGRSIVLGIETSCDDTGCGIVDSRGNVLGEALCSQQVKHLRFGGIIPPIARDLHAQNVSAVCEDALRLANLKLKDIDAVAATVKPGLSLSLMVGTNFGKYLAKIGNKPLIPIHHMEAHALTIRMIEKVDFPYLVLLLSGGHSMIALVKDIDEFYVLGNTKDNSPGEILDKVSRRLKLRNIPELEKLNGGRAIEEAAKKATDLDQFPFASIMTQYNDCYFSFSGLFNICRMHIAKQERKHNVVGDMIIPDVYNLCAAFQMALIKHVSERMQRAMVFADRMSLIPRDKRKLVISGGVACNNTLASVLQLVCSELEYDLIRTPPKLCTDNGVMIAWNGIERLIADKGVLRDANEVEKVRIEDKATLGLDWTQKVQQANIKCKWVKIRKKLLEER